MTTPAATFRHHDELLVSSATKPIAVGNHKPRVVLASRKNAGIKVMLLWAADTNAVAVLVRNECTDDQFELILGPEVNPMDVYEHPYAYAAWQGIDYRT